MAYQSLVNAIEDIYSDTKAKVLSPDGETEYFSITAGVLQGDTLAPYLFIIVIDYALRKALKGKEEELGFQLKRRQSSRVGPEVITDLDFADDIALLSEQTTQAQEMLTRVEQASSEVGLRANGKKTKVLTYNTGREINLKTTDGTTLEVVDDLKYLGSWVNSTEQDIKTRKALAWKACNKMSSIWKTTLPRTFKVRLLSATVESVLLYGCESWTLTQKLEKMLDGCYTRLL